MYWNRSAADISAAWQTEIESKQETGSSALLIGGRPDNMITGIATLLGMQSSTVQRNDVAMPLFRRCWVERTSGDQPLNE